MLGVVNVASDQAEVSMRNFAGSEWLQSGISDIWAKTDVGRTRTGMSGQSAWNVWELSMKQGGEIAEVSRGEGQAGNAQRFRPAENVDR